MTYQTLNFMGREKLEAAGIIGAENDARELVMWVGNMNLTQYSAKLSAEATETEKERYFDAVGKRCHHMPLQQITGYAPFAGHLFYVNNHVLIPRPDTETLVVESGKYVTDNSRILDIGTGSGCVLLSLLYEHPSARGVGVDISSRALQVARMNAARLGVKAEWIESDLFSEVEGSYDVIVSNPPYIESTVIETLEPEVKNYEPILALDGYQDGLHFYRRIVRDAPEYMKDGGVLAFEIGATQGASVRDMMERADFGNVTIHRDLSGKDRVVIGEYHV